MRTPSGDRPPESTGQQEQNETEQNEAEPSDQSTKVQMPEHSQPSNPVHIIQNLSSSFSGLAGVLKLLFYAVAAIAVAYLVWKYRRQLVQAIADILQQLRELIAGLLGGKPAADHAAAEEQTSAARARSRRFADFRDPFATGEHRQIPPDELVRYTFAAFEAWANDHGCPAHARSHAARADSFRRRGGEPDVCGGPANGAAVLRAGLRLTPRLARVGQRAGGTVDDDAPFRGGSVVLSLRERKFISRSEMSTLNCTTTNRWRKSCSSHKMQGRQFAVGRR